MILFITIPLLGSLVVALTSSPFLQKQVALITTAITFLMSLALWSIYQSDLLKPQLSDSLAWLDILNLTFLIGIDGIGLIFIVLTTLLFFLCVLSTWQVIKHQVKAFLISLLVTEVILLAIFMVSDLVVFYVLFESVLIPIFLLIGLGGSRERKVRAGFMFFLYTVVGSILMLLAVVFLQVRVGSASFFLVQEFNFSILEQKLLWLAFFLAFAGKIPMIPLHVWLPEAHVEAPTSGSVILAGILLKLGSYGLIKVSLGVFGKIGVFFSPIFSVLGIIGVIYASFTAIRQTDLKRIIAYTSVAHMNLVVIGILTYTTCGVEGAIFQSLSHGFVSSALFFCVGVIYDRYHTRLLAFYSGISFFMPNFVFFLVLFTMANIALPGTSSFVGEFLILLGIYKYNTILCLMASTTMILGGVYSLWLLNRLSFGNLGYAIRPTKDIVPREFIVLLVLGLGTVVFGIYSEPILKEIRFIVSSLLI